MKRNFDNHTEAGFYDYMMSHRDYKESTVWDYIKRLRKIESMDTLFSKNLDPYITDYEAGNHSDMNAICHNAFSCALKRLQEYQEYRGIVII